MKKLLLSLLTIISLTAFAQRDLEIRYLLPVNGAEVAGDRPFNVAFSVKNLGPDSVFGTDSMVIAVLWDFSPVYADIFGVVNPLGAGDSVIFTLSDVSIPVSKDTMATFCAVAQFTDSTTATTDSMSNNIDCNVLNLKVIGTGFGESQTLAQSVKAYPNPANSYFTLTMNASNASVEVMDITGKLIETAAVTMGEARLDVSNYKNGVYFYHIRNAAGSVETSGKFTVSH